MGRKKFFITEFMSVCLGLLFSFFSFDLHAENNSEKSSNSESSNTVTRRQTNIANNRAIFSNPGNDSFVKAASSSLAGVVHVRTVMESDESEMSNVPDPFEEFFGLKRKTNPQKIEASGSGVIISKDGYIATNHHVVDNADNIEVTLYDNRTFKAKVIGVDSQTDLALLKIEAEDLTLIPYGNAEEIKVGEWVLAVGNPFNLTSTVTAGIVSAKGRNIHLFNTNYGVEAFIQTDAAVNPGNSGGALVNLRGQLIGINTAIASPNGAYAGYAFAIPVSIVEKVINDLKNYGVVQRAILGIVIQNVNSELAKEKNLSVVNGVYIDKVNPGSAAQKAGIKPNDIIIKVNTTNVTKVGELQEAIALHKPGDKVTVTILRKSKVKTVMVNLQNLVGSEESLSYKKESSIKIGGSTFGNITKSTAKKLHLKDGVELVKLGNGVWREAGLKQGFVLTSVDHRKVRNTNDLVNIIHSHKGGGVLVEGIYPDGTRAYYGLDLMYN